MKLNKIIFSLDNIITTLIVFFVIDYVTFYQNLDFLNPFINIIQDLKITDIVFSKVRNEGRYSVDSNIVLVNIANLNRQDIARQIRIINKYKPKVLAIDSFFRNLKGEANDSALANALAESDNLVMASKIHYSYQKNEFDSVSYSHPVFSNKATFGFANVSEELQGKTYKDMSPVEKEEFNAKFLKTIREISPKEYIKGVRNVFFAVRIAEIVAPQKAKRFIDRNNEKELVNFRRNIDKYITFDADDIFAEDNKLESMRNKVVLMGFLGPDVHTAVSEDAFFTPMNPQFVGKAFPDMYGIVIHANVLSMILDESYFFAMPDWTTNYWLILILYILMACLKYVRHKYEHFYEPISIALIFASLFFWFAVIIILFNSFKIYIDLNMLFFVILMAIPVFEAYHDSLKPLFLGRVNAIKGHFSKKKIIESEAEQ